MASWRLPRGALSTERYTTLGREKRGIKCVSINNLIIIVIYTGAVLRAVRHDVSVFSICVLE